MKNLTVLIKPASSLCNMRCSYCFYADISQMRQVPSYGMMTTATADALVDNVFADLADGDAIAFAFQGGEPTLAGLDFYRQFVARVRVQKTRANVSFSLQTNGVLLNEEWCLFLRRHRFLVGLSLDGEASLHDANRLDDKGKGSYKQVLQAKKNMDAAGVQYNILCVLTNEIARHPQKIWRFLLRENIEYVQFTPCLDELGAAEKTPYALTPRRFFSFYNALFPLWRREVENGRYISVKLFDDIANQHLRRQVTACGMNGRCGMQFVVEADGGVYPCDFYVLDDWRLGSLATETPRTLYEKGERAGFAAAGKTLEAACAQCRYAGFCGGGCKRMKRAMYVDETGFCGYRAFLDAHLKALLATADKLLRGLLPPPGQ